MTRRLAVTGLAVLAVVSLATSACATGPGATPTPSVTRSATDVLNEAVAKTTGQSFTYTLTYGTQLSADGARDATGTNAFRNIQFTDAASGLIIKANVLAVGNALYAKLDLGPLGGTIPGLAGLGNKWLTVDRTKIGTTGLAAGLVPTGDSLTVDSYIKGVVSAETVSATEIKGTIDLAKSAPTILPAAEVAKLAPEAKMVPFSATLDAEGRIAKILINLPKVGQYVPADLITTYAGHGAPVEVAKPPASETVAAPEMIYIFLK